MTPALFPEMAQSTFKPLIGRLNEDGLQRAYSPDEIQELLVACSFGAAVLDTLSEMFQAFLRRGLEARKMRILREAFAQTVELAITDVYSRVRNIVTGPALPKGEQVNAIEMLDDFRNRALSMREDLEPLRHLLEGPMPKLDTDLATASVGSANGEHYANLDDVLARLRVGGDV